MDCFVAEPVIGPRVRADPLAPRNDESPHASSDISPSGSPNSNVFSVSDTSV